MLDSRKQNGKIKYMRNKGGGDSIGETKTETGVWCIKMPPSVAELLKSKNQTAITEWVFPHFYGAVVYLRKTVYISAEVTCRRINESFSRPVHRDVFLADLHIVDRPDEIIAAVIDGIGIIVLLKSQTELNPIAVFFLQHSYACLVLLKPVTWDTIALIKGGV